MHIIHFGNLQWGDVGTEAFLRFKIPKQLAIDDTNVEQMV